MNSVPCIKLAMQCCPYVHWDRLQLIHRTRSGYKGWMVWWSGQWSQLILMNYSHSDKMRLLVSGSREDALAGPETRSSVTICNLLAAGRPHWSQPLWDNIIFANHICQWRIIDVRQKLSWRAESRMKLDEMDEGRRCGSARWKPPTAW